MIEQINALGYGLTLGLQTRIDSRAERPADASARVGNVYVNRNIVGAVVGVQPFGAKASGTGPKAGGPHYLRRFVAELSIDAPVPPLRLDGRAEASAIAADGAWSQTRWPSASPAEPRG